MITVLVNLAGLAALTGGVLAIVRVAYSAHPRGVVADQTRRTTDGGETTTGQDHHPVHHGTFGNDRFGMLAERFARAFGTPQFIIGQTVLVALWIATNAVAFGLHWDPYPFILLNLAFSTQAAYAAPLILLAQTRQAERDRIRDSATQEHRDAQLQRREEFESQLRRMLDGDRVREEAHEALLARQSALVDELGRALGLLQAPGTAGAEKAPRATAVTAPRAGKAPRGAPSGS